jgi:hypothetical protein
MGDLMRTLGSFTCGLLDVVGVNACPTYSTVTAAGIVTFGILVTAGLLVVLR